MTEEPSMQKFFNIAGPCQPEAHYMLPAQERCQDLLHLIAQQQYFVIHAARQTGKTTLLQELAQQLNAAGQYHALYCSLETLQGLLEPEKGIPAILKKLTTEVRFTPPLAAYPFAVQADYQDYTNVLRNELTFFCQTLAKPLIILFDEIDCLANGTLITFLRQLRDGYVNRGRIPFVHAVALVGMRNIRDYKAHLRDDRDTLGSASPFNIVSEALTLRNFSSNDVARLYAQHTAQTGQDFPDAVIERVYAYTQGQPWLVNAIAREIVEKILQADVQRSIEPEHVEQAVQTLIARRDTHIDSLMERLREARVKRIVEPLIVGETRRYDLLDDDYRYVLDLGLLREVGTSLAPANPIYGEIIVRTLTFRSQSELDDLKTLPEAPTYIVAGHLDMTRLLKDFQQFWRENSDIWVKKYEYQEAAPHLILQAFLQRVINSHGQVTREMAAGTERLDLCVQKTYAEGRAQLAGYMDTLGCNEGWLLVFDRRKRVSWKQKLFWQTHADEDKTVHVVGC